MGQHRIGVRVNLSPAAERRFLHACKVQGGQTRFIEEAIEHYVHQLDVMEKLESIEKLLQQLVSSMNNVPSGSRPVQVIEEKQNDSNKHNLDPSQLEAAVSTLRAFMGGEDI